MTRKSWCGNAGVGADDVAALHPPIVESETSAVDAGSFRFLQPLSSRRLRRDEV